MLTFLPQVTKGTLSYIIGDIGVSFSANLGILRATAKQIQGCLGDEREGDWMPRNFKITKAALVTISPQPQQLWALYLQQPLAALGSFKRNGSNVEIPSGISFHLQQFQLHWAVSLLQKPESTVTSGACLDLWTY